MNKNVKFTVKLLSIPFSLMLFMALLNVYSHVNRVDSLKKDFKQCVNNLEKVSYTCSKSLCEIVYNPNREKDIEKCISIQEKLDKSIEVKDSLFLLKIINQ